MFHPRSFFFASLLAGVAVAPACGDDARQSSTQTPATGGGGEGGSAGGPTEPGPGPEFDAFCGESDWRDTLAEQTLGELFGDYVGALQSDEIVAGTMEGQKFVPDHPFKVERIRVAFAGEGGPVRLRLMRTFGRSFPWPWPDTSDTSQDLMPPIDLEVATPDPEQPIEIDVSATPIFLLPTQHYVLVYEHLQPQPLLAIEGVLAADRQPERDYSRAGIFFPATSDGGGIGGTPEYPSVNYSVELLGASFCQMDDDARLFGRAASPFDNEPSSYLSVADFDADDHDDLVIYVAGQGAVGYRGLGDGTFSALGYDAFAAAPEATMLVFGDVDNDGDRDAFAGTWVQVDADSDGVDVITEGDCNNAPGNGPSVRPSAAEVMGNRRDDNCDGIIDDGTDTSDGDSDGFSVADGDCDDTEATMFPGNPERLDMLDNDCNLAVDEIFVNKMLLNDGTGHFTQQLASGVEVIDPSTSGAFGDGNGDGMLDIYWGNWLFVYPEDAAVQDRYFEGNGDGTFVDAQAAAGMVLPKAYSAFSVMWNDFDNDADHDILVTNYHLYPNQLWQNTAGAFVDVAPDLGVAVDDIPSMIAAYPGGHTFGADFGDIDGDGDMDLYLANLSHPRFQPWSDPSQMLINGGAPGFAFENHLEELGMVYDEGDANAAFADYDNDGDLDLAIASLYEAHFSRLYRNDGAAGFVDVTYQAGLSVRDAIAVSWSDVDEDGDLDLFTSDRGGEPYVHLFINRSGQDRPWVELELEGTTSTRDAVGARVHLSAGGATQMRDVRDGGGHGNAQQTHLVHFGLGDAAAIDSVEVRWLGGATETFSGVAPNGRYRLVEGAGVAAPM